MTFDLHYLVFNTKNHRINGGFLMVGLAGLEPATSSLSVTRSNQLSYKPVVERIGFEPMTPCLQSRCSSQLS